MRIGFDFDNTIVCYDQTIARLADELFDFPKELPRTKLALRDHLRKLGREPVWTAFQGELYGPGMAYAEPFEGCIETLQEFKSAGFHMYIVSHRSRHPYAGPAYDLHAFARQWVQDHLVKKGLFHTSDVYFNETRKEKVAVIAGLGCTVFFDDLPEVFEEPSFPKETCPVLFGPQKASTYVKNYMVATDWQEFPAIIRILTT